MPTIAPATARIIMVGEAGLVGSVFPTSRTWLIRTPSGKGFSGATRLTAMTPITAGTNPRQWGRTKGRKACRVTSADLSPRPPEELNRPKIPLSTYSPRYYTTGHRHRDERRLFSRLSRGARPCAPGGVAGTSLRPCRRRRSGGGNGRRLPAHGRSFRVPPPAWPVPSSRSVRRRPAPTRRRHLRSEIRASSRRRTGSGRGDLHVAG